MFQNWQCIVSKILLIIMILLIFYLLTNLNKEETFMDSLEKEKNNYLKMKETYIEPEDTSLDLLYANYSGEEVNSDVWQNKILDQCVDTCNKLEGCIGFSRDAVLDTEPANCYPRSAVNNCHSNRKGNSSQMQNALKYDSYVKSYVPNILNNCIGDSDLTLNRLIFIKSYLQPKSYIGINGDSRIVLVNKDNSNSNSNSNFISNCNFRLEVGKDGIGTISFLHIGSGKYLYRDVDDSIILKSVSSPGKTIDNQRVSFNLYDAVSGCVMIKPMMLDGETTDKFIMLDNNTNYLVAKTLNSTKSDNSESSSAFFYIVDSIISSNIITNKNNMPTTRNIPTTPTTPTTPYMPTPTTPYIPTPTTPYMPTPTTPYIPTPTTRNMPTPTTRNIPTTSNIPTTTTRNMPTPTTRNIPTTSNIPIKTSYRTIPTTLNYNTEGFKNIKEGFTLDLDTSTNNLEYNNLFNPPQNIILSDYIQDNYSISNNTSSHSAYLQISNKLNNIEINKQLSNSLTKNQDELKSIIDLNKEIELEITNLNNGLNNKNDIIINNLDKMRVSDLANDYFFLKNLPSV